MSQYPFKWMNEERSTPEGFAKHIFDWGMQSFPLKPELYRAERNKAIQQMKDFAVYLKELEAVPPKAL